MLNFSTIKSKLIVVLIASLLGLLVLSVYALVSEKSSLLDDRRARTQQLVEAATGVVVHFHGLFKKGELSEEAAKSAALQTLQGLRYDKTEYFWVNDMTPKMLMHPTNPKLNGTDISENKDTTGKNIWFVSRIRGCFDIFLMPGCAATVISGALPQAPHSPLGSCRGLKNIPGNCSERWPPPGGQEAFAA